jgi:hypothetical protein
MGQCYKIAITTKKDDQAKKILVPSLKTFKN